MFSSVTKVEYDQIAEASKSLRSDLTMEDEVIVTIEKST